MNKSSEGEEGCVDPHEESYSLPQLSNRSEYVAGTALANELRSTSMYPLEELKSYHRMLIEIQNGSKMMTRSKNVNIDSISSSEAEASRYHPLTNSQNRVIPKSKAFFHSFIASPYFIDILWKHGVALEIDYLRTGFYRL